MYLTTPVTDLPGISTRYAQKLAKLRISTVKDLITHFPRYHKDTRVVTPISKMQQPGQYVISAKVADFKSVRIRGGRTLQTAWLLDETAKCRATWFNQPYLAKSILAEQDYLILGNYKESKGKLQFYPTSLEPLHPEGNQLHLGRITPQYPLTAGLGIKWLRARLDELLKNLSTINDLEDELKTIQPELNLENDLKQSHFPTGEAELDSAWKRLQLRELTHLQLKTLSAAAQHQIYTAPRISIDKKILAEFISELNFELTQGQNTSVTEILQDLAKDKPMRRILQGDVGSGKTIVAVIAALATYKSGYQTIVLAPTTILAAQHMQTFHKFLATKGVSVALVSSETATYQPADVLIGTSAILARQKKLLNKPGLIIIDEQHRFGTAQRESQLIFEQNKYPHVLDMTATPIPRTLALGLFGDLEISRITHKPVGRLPIHTRQVPESKRQDAVEWIKSQITAGGQVYWVCPLVEDNDKLAAKAAKATLDELKSQLPEVKIDLLHGQMKPAQKSLVMEQFALGQTQLLVCTSVVEVGLDVPMANIIVIENAERFGLAQLHQMRGRVGRGTQQSWCLLFTDPEINTDTQARIDFFAASQDGLAVAEFDLKSRGPGEVYGQRQSGLPPLKIATLNDISQILQARELAKQLYAQGIRKLSLFDN